MGGPPRLLIVVSAPSGAGKTSLCREAVRRIPGLAHSVSYTTRAPRAHEVAGRDYHFVDEATFRRMVRAGDFAEWATVHGHLYGTSRPLLDAHFAAGQDVILDIDTQGAAQLRRVYTDGIFVFVLPPSWEQLEERLRARKSDAPEEIERRLRKARDEMKVFTEYHYVVINDVFERAVEDLYAIIVAERCRSVRLDSRVREELGI
ncbi:MAG: guanylate kinase [candidate division NC10 bacterium]|nr:guanylate kinase [candidate division NC10 bacterium]HZX61153.1 guanylate kinase [Candidatus Methylomirabilis sp.]